MKTPRPPPDPKNPNDGNGMNLTTHFFMNYYTSGRPSASETLEKQRLENEELDRRWKSIFTLTSSEKRFVNRLQPEVRRYIREAYNTETGPEFQPSDGPCEGMLPSDKNFQPCKNHQPWCPRFFYACYYFPVVSDCYGHAAKQYEAYTAWKSSTTGRCTSFPVRPDFNTDPLMPADRYAWTACPDCRGFLRGQYKPTEWVVYMPPYDGKEYCWKRCSTCLGVCWRPITEEKKPHWKPSDGSPLKPLSVIFGCAPHPPAHDRGTCSSKSLIEMPTSPPLLSNLKSLDDDRGCSSKSLTEGVSSKPPALNTSKNPWFARNGSAQFDLLKNWKASAIGLWTTIPVSDSGDSVLPVDPHKYTMKPCPGCRGFYDKSKVNGGTCEWVVWMPPDNGQKFDWLPCPTCRGISWRQLTDTKESKPSVDAKEGVLKLTDIPENSAVPGAAHRSAKRRVNRRRQKTDKMLNDKDAVKRVFTPKSLPCHDELAAMYERVIPTKNKDRLQLHQEMLAAIEEYDKLPGIKIERPVSPPDCTLPSPTACKNDATSVQTEAPSGPNPNAKAPDAPKDQPGSPIAKRNRYLVHMAEEEKLMKLRQEQSETFNNTVRSLPKQEIDPRCIRASVREGLMAPNPLEAYYLATAAFGYPSYSYAEFKKYFETCLEFKAPNNDRLAKALTAKKESEYEKMFANRYKDAHYLTEIVIPEPFVTGPIDKVKPPRNPYGKAQMELDNVCDPRGDDSIP